MNQLIQQLIDFLNQIRLHGATAINQWVPDAFEALTSRLRWILWWSIIVLVGSLLASGLLHLRWFLPLIGVGYFLLILVILHTADTLRGAGLLLSVDAAIDLFRGLTPINIESLKKLVTLGLDFPRLKALATLQLVGRLVFNVVLFELGMLLLFGIVPIWTYPQLASYLVLGAIFYGLLQIPWAQASPFFKRLTKPVGTFCLLIIGLLLWGELRDFRQINTLAEQFRPIGFPELPDISGFPIPLWFWALALILVGILGSSLLPKKLRQLFVVAGILVGALWLATPPSPRLVGARAVAAAPAETATVTVRLENRRLPRGPVKVFLLRPDGQKDLRELIRSYWWWERDCGPGDVLVVEDTAGKPLRLTRVSTGEVVDKVEYPSRAETYNIY